MSESGDMFRFAERCLYEYQENAARLEQLRADLEHLSSVSVTNYEAEGAPPAGGHSDPVWAYVGRVMDIEEEIARLARRTEPITRMRANIEAPYVLEGSLKYELAQVMKLYYFGGNDKGKAAKTLGMSRRTLYNKREQLVRMTLRYMGL